MDDAGFLFPRTGNWCVVEVSAMSDSLGVSSFVCFVTAVVVVVCGREVISFPIGTRLFLPKIARKDFFGAFCYCPSVLCRNSRKISQCVFFFSQRTLLVRMGLQV